MVSHQSQAMHHNDLAPTLRDPVAVLLAGYGEVQSYRDLNRYNQAATKYIAAQFVPIPEWLYPAAGRLLALQDLYNFGVKHVTKKPAIPVLRTSSAQKRPQP